MLSQVSDLHLDEEAQILLHLLDRRRFRYQPRQRPSSSFHSESGRKPCPPIQILALG